MSSNNKLPPDWETTFWHEFEQWEKKEQGTKLKEHAMIRRARSLYYKEIQEIFAEAEVVQSTNRYYFEQYKIIVDWLNRVFEPKLETRVGRLNTAYLQKIGLEQADADTFLEDMHTITNLALSCTDSPTSHDPCLIFLKSIINKPCNRIVLAKIKEDKKNIWLLFVTFWSFIALLQDLAKVYSPLLTPRTIISAIDKRQYEEMNTEFNAYIQGCLKSLFVSHTDQNSPQIPLDDRIIQKVQAISIVLQKALIQ